MYKLLVLGATYNEIVVIERAKAKGIYTIVTDNNTDYSKSPAKYVADEAWNISWSDIDSLYLKCKESIIDGIIAGFSEFRVENMIKLCARLELPCPLTMEQLDITRDKIKFKALCNQYGISGVPEFKYGSDIQFPVIIKPVDRAGSIGINVVYDKDDFEKYYQYALSLSPSQSVIVEKYIDDGIKFDVYYFVINGVITLLGTSDTIMCEGTEAAPILQKAWVFPSVYESKFVKEEDVKLRKMLQGLGIVNGYVTISAFCTNGQFYFFEAGFRLSGELSFNYYKAFSNINYIDLLIDYSLGIELNQTLEEAAGNKQHSVILNFFGKDGKVKDMKLPNPEECKSLISSNIYIKENEKIQNVTNILKKVAMYTLYSSDATQITKDIEYINSHFSIENEIGENLIYEKVDTGCLGLNVLANKHGISVMQKPYYVTWSEIQSLLNAAHEDNYRKGLKYATYNQPVSKLKEKVHNGVCFVGIKDSQLVATATIQYRNLNYWYHNGFIGLLKLLGISPEYRGLGLGSVLLNVRTEHSAKQNVKVLVSDSAEKNLAVRHLYLKHGFKIVDCCKYANNNFFSTVYAKWLEQCPWNDSEIQEKYTLRRNEVHKSHDEEDIKKARVDRK